MNFLRFSILTILMVFLTSQIRAQPQPGLDAIAWPDDMDQPHLDINSRCKLVSFQDRLLLIGARHEDHQSGLYRPLCWLDGGQWVPENGFCFSGTSPRSVVWNDHLILAGDKPSSADGQKPGSTGLTSYDGKAWTAVSSDFQGKVSSLVVWNGDLVVAGELIIENHPELTGLARWDGQQWHPVGGQPSGVGTPRILSLAVHNGCLVVGGLFTQMGSTPVSNLAIYGENRWEPLGAASNGVITSVVSFRGQLYVTGKFDCIGQKSIPKLARWDGQQWHALGAVDSAGELSSSRQQFGLRATPNWLYVRGAMEALSGRKRAKLERWNGQSWDLDFQSFNHWIESALGSVAPVPQLAAPLKEPKTFSQPKDWKETPYEPPSPPSYYNYQRIGSMAWHEDGLVVFSFKRMDHGVSSLRLDLLKQGQWKSILPEPKLPGTVVGPYQDGMLVENRRSRGVGPFSKWTPDGVESLGLWPENERPPRFKAKAVRGDSIVVLGNFHRFAGRTLHHVALFDGQTWQPLGQGIPFDRVRDGKVYFSGDRIFVVGSFTNSGFTENPGYLIWDGKIWSFQSMEPGERPFSFQFVASESGFFRSPKGNYFSERLLGPDHTQYSFPLESNPIIEQWTAEGWVQAWQGRTGQVAGFFSDGAKIWAAIDRGVDANILKNEKGQWKVVSSLPLPGKSIVDINPIKGVTVYQGRPLVWGNFLVGDPLGAHELVCYSGGEWWLFPQSFWGEPRLIPSDDRMMVSGFMNEKQWGSRSPLQTYWDGPLAFSGTIEPANLDSLEAFRQLCLKSDQSYRPHLDLPWPKGIPKLEDPEKLPLWKRQGWYLEKWPKVFEPGDFARMTDDGVISIDPSCEENQLFREETLIFQFDWPAQMPGLVEFEYRQVEAGDWSPEEKPQGLRSEYGNHPVFRESDSPPGVFWQWGGIGHRLHLLSGGGKWQKVGVFFLGERYPWRNELSWEGGVTRTGIGRLEIRNIQFHQEGPDLEKFFQELHHHLDQYDWTVEGRSLLEKALSREKTALGKTSPGDTDSFWFVRWWGLDKEVGLNFRKFNNFLAIDLKARERDQEISLLVTNRDGAVGWIPGGGLYVSGNNPTRDQGCLWKVRQTLADPTIRQFVKGVVWDLRQKSYPSSQYCLHSFSHSNQAMGVFSDVPRSWGKVLEPDWSTSGGGDFNTISMVTEPADDPWPADIPLVVLVDGTTPGHEVMTLNNLPNITTVGDPSGPVIVPSRPVLMTHGQWVYFPAGKVFDLQGKNVSFTRIIPEIRIEPNASYDTAIRRAMEIIGIEPDPDAAACPWN